MAGRIRDEDIALVRERTSIADVISEHVTLKSAGGGNLKGLCPFHDEKTPSFTVAPGRNVYFCHGCGHGRRRHQVPDGRRPPDVRRVGRAAGRPGRHPAALRSRAARPRSAPAAGAEAAAGRRARRRPPSSTPASSCTPGARLAREFLAQRGFGRDAAEHFGCGFAPDALGPRSPSTCARRASPARSWSPPGLSREARSGSLIDRFRRRLLWPIRELSGDVIGFGARKLFEDDDGPKYLNTPETPLYKKSHVLYGIDHAKREIAKQGRAVIVEGYTDVMACHLAGVKTAVATCGTSFGADHIGVLRRLLMDTDASPGEIIFTFDGDAAGQKAALRAFEEDQRFVGRTFIAVSPDNMDPCELRLAKGDLAVRDLVARREPLVDFALRQMLTRFDLDTVDGRVEAMRRAAPLVAKLKDREKRPEYVRKLAGDLGMEIEPVQRAVMAAAATRPGGAEAAVTRPRVDPDADTPQARVEREALKLAIQVPVLAGPMFDAIGEDAYGHPVHAAVRAAIAEAGGAASGTSGAVWIERVRDACGDLGAKALVGELAVEPLRLDGEPDPRYVGVTAGPAAVGRGDHRGSATSSRRCSGSTRSPTKTNTWRWPVSCSRWSSTRAPCASRRRAACDRFLGSRSGGGRNCRPAPTCRSTPTSG